MSAIQTLAIEIIASVKALAYDDLINCRCGYNIVLREEIPGLWWDWPQQDAEAKILERLLKETAEVEGLEVEWLSSRQLIVRLPAVRKPNTR